MVRTNWRMKTKAPTGLKTGRKGLINPRVGNYLTFQSSCTERWTEKFIENTVSYCIGAIQAITIAIYDKTLTSGFAFEEGPAHWPAALAGAWHFCSCSEKLVRYADCTGYGFIPIIIHFVAFPVMEKICYGFLPSHGSLLCSPVHCRISGFG